MATPGFAQQVDPAAYAKAQQLMSVMGVDKSIAGVTDDQAKVDSSTLFLKIKILEANPGQEAKVTQVVNAAYRASMTPLLPEYLNYVTGLYASAFTPQELDQMAAFMQTPAMQHMRAAAVSGQDPPQADMDAINAYNVTPLGQKMTKVLPDITQKMNVYTVDVLRVKGREQIYAELREDLPRAGLNVPNPFQPDTFIDQKLHDNAMGAQ